MEEIASLRSLIVFAFVCAIGGGGEGVGGTGGGAKETRGLGAWRIGTVCTGASLTGEGGI